MVGSKSAQAFSRAWDDWQQKSKLPHYLPQRVWRRLGNSYSDNKIHSGVWCDQHSQDFALMPALTACQWKSALKRARAIEKELLCCQLPVNIDPIINLMHYLGYSLISTEILLSYRPQLNSWFSRSSSILIGLIINLDLLIFSSSRLSQILGYTRYMQTKHYYNNRCSGGHEHQAWRFTTNMYEPSEIQRFRILSRSYRSAVIDDSEGAVIAAINLATQIMAIREIYEQISRTFPGHW